MFSKGFSSRAHFVADMTRDSREGNVFGFNVVAHIPLRIALIFALFAFKHRISVRTVNHFRVYSFVQLEET